MEQTATFVTPLQLNLEALASVDNPTLNYMEFVFTDDQPNANGKGIHQSDFPSIIRTGLLMPVKMAEGGISPGHAGTSPIGVISSLEERKSEDGRNLVVGKAALWSRERPEDINLIKEAYAAGKQLNISWEVLYTETEVDANGIEWYKEPITRAATFVGLPAYKGRTPMLSVASDEKQEELNMDELEKVTADLATANSRIAELETASASKDEEIATLSAFKAEVELERANASLLKERLTKFAEAGIQFSAEDVEAKKDKWLKLDNEAFDYLVSEMQSLVKTDEASVTEPVIPASVANNPVKTRVELARAGLQALKTK